MREIIKKENENSRYFFESLQTNEERWDFIERYFLGMNDLG